MSLVANKSDPITSVMMKFMDELNEIRIFREFMLQDPKTLEKYEQFKTFKALKDTK